jgi:hypothetical protein
MCVCLTDVNESVRSMTPARGLRVAYGWLTGELGAALPGANALAVCQHRSRPDDRAGADPRPGAEHGLAHLGALLDPHVVVEHGVA